MTGKNVKSLMAATVLALGAMSAGSVSAAVIIDASVGGVPNGASIYENFDGLAVGGGGGVTASGITVSFTGDGNVVQGSQPGQYAAPFLSGGNGALFGNADGPDASPYIGSGIGSVELLLPGDHQYFGILWGSVDAYNMLQFYDGADLLFSFSGTDVDAVASGDQGAAGTYYVNINSDTAFNRVVASSTSYAFEFDNVALAEAPIGPGPSDVSAPGALGVLGLGLVGMAVAARRRRN